MWAEKVKKYEEEMGVSSQGIDDLQGDQKDKVQSILDGMGLSMGGASDSQESSKEEEQKQQHSVHDEL